MMIYNNGKYRKATAEEEKEWANVPAPEDHEAIYHVIFGDEDIKVEEAKKLKKLIDEKINEKDWKGG